MDRGVRTDGRQTRRAQSLMPRDGGSATDAPAGKRRRGRERVFVSSSSSSSSSRPPAHISHSAATRVLRRARTSLCTVSVSGRSSLLRWRPSSALILGLSRDMSVTALRSHNQHTAAVSRALDAPARLSLASIACGDRPARPPPPLRRGATGACSHPALRASTGPHPRSSARHPCLGLPPTTCTRATSSPALRRRVVCLINSIHTSSRGSDLWTSM